jgi:hypothetical protein
MTQTSVESGLTSDARAAVMPHTPSPADLLLCINPERIHAALADGSAPAPPGGLLDPAAAAQPLSEAREQAPNSRRWKLRDRIGERTRFHELPQATAHH